MELTNICTLSINLREHKVEDQLVQLGIAGLIIIKLFEFMRWLLKRKPLITTNPHPEATKTGDLAASYWLQEFSKINEGLRRIETLLRERLPR